MQNTENFEGTFLISEAEQGDKNFLSTILLIINHNNSGAFGLVLNKKSDLRLGDILPEHFGDHSARSYPIFVGGPVEQNYLFVLQRKNFISENESIKICNSVYFVPNTSRILDIMYNSWTEENASSAFHELRFFMGYSGWAPGQLEMEVEQEMWMLHPANSEVVFHQKPEDIWYELLHNMGGLYSIIAETGYKPSMN